MKQQQQQQKKTTTTFLLMSSFQFRLHSSTLEAHFSVLSAQAVKLWPNGLAIRRKFSTSVSFGHPFALTFVNFGRAQIRTQVDASFSPFGHPTQSRHKLIASQLYMREIYDLRIRLGTLRKSARKSQKAVNLTHIIG